ncbi:hypothetical protein ACFUTX_10260 [Microbacterium sp. NPDC057407]|uniref:hypothetical protein n=1 Tax=Microbacterium sp. NPDC057407 TaxID=3346120 RepID=UPI00366F1003
MMELLALIMMALLLGVAVASLVIVLICCIRADTLKSSVCAALIALSLGFIGIFELGPSPVKVMQILGGTWSLATSIVFLAATALFGTGGVLLARRFGLIRRVLRWLEASGD